MDPRQRRGNVKISGGSGFGVAGLCGKGRESVVVAEMREGALRRNPTEGEGGENSVGGFTQV